MEVLLPYHMCAYAWDEPHLEHKVDLEWQPNEGILRREFLGTYNFDPSVPQAEPAAETHLKIRVVTRGSTRVMVLMDDRLGGPEGLGLGDGKAASSTPTLPAWDVHLEVLAQGVGVSLVSTSPLAELLYASARDIRVSWGLQVSDDIAFPTLTPNLGP